jgi:predicted enzyme related to lactoylglutathione lyase
LAVDLVDDPSVAHSADARPKISLNEAMGSLLTEIVIESSDPVRAATFWSAALGWELREYMPGKVPWMSASGDPDEHDLKLVFVQTRRGREPSNRLYLNPRGSDLSDEVQRLCDLGATVADTSAVEAERQTPWIALVDPGGTGLTVLPARVD